MKNPFIRLFRARDKPGATDSVSSAPTFYFGSSAAGKSITASTAIQMSTVRYDMATDACAITTAINQASQNIMQNCNANYRALHDEITAIQMAAKDEKIAEQANLINALNLSASQSNQNAYLVEQMKQLVKTGCCGSGC